MESESEVPDEPDYIEVMDFEKYPFTFTWFYRALAVTDANPNDPFGKFGQRRVDIVDRFLNLWICLNSIQRDNYGEGLNDNDLERRLVSDTNWKEFFRSASGSEYAKHISELKGLSPVQDMKNPTHLVYFNDGSFEELIPFVRQIRNNLFHGRKNPDDIDPSDKRRIELSYFLLAPLIVTYMQHNGMIHTRFQSSFEYEWTRDGVWFDF